MRLFHTVGREIPENLKTLLLMNLLAAAAAMSWSHLFQPPRKRQAPVVSARGFC
jgi:hypothetical protein